MEYRYKEAESATRAIDVEVTIVQGSEFINSHTVIGKLLKPTYFVELELDNVEEENNMKVQTCGGHRAENGHHEWDERFIFAANQSSRLSLKLNCKHSTMRDSHVIGETTCDVWDIPRHENITIDLYDAKKRVSGKITLCLTVAATVTFSAGLVPNLDLQSLYSLSQMTKIVDLLSGEELDKFSPAWRRFIYSLDIVASTAQKLSELHPPVRVALGAVVFALKIVLEQIGRDERIENMVGIMGDLYAYVADTYSIEKIASYKETLRTLLAQTTECSYFIAEYRKVTQFSRRAVVNLVSNADAMIKRFEDTFRDLKIELILGSSLQTAVVSFRVLQKVENIETILYTKELKSLKMVGWDSDRTCFRGTRNATINDLVQWASNCEESGMAEKNRILVLQGPQGCGKSSIAHSVAEAFHLQNRLGAAIFLDDRTEEKIVGSQILSTTIASQLTAYDQNIREAIAAKIQADASLAKADVRRQFRDLIVSATKGLALIGPICIIIDGLQKVVSPAEQLRFLTAIADHFPKLPSNFRLILTSQYGPTSEDIAQLMPSCIIKEITFDDEGTIVDYSKHISDSLRHLFSKKLKLAEKYTIEDLRDQFIERSMGVYFWISTACQFLLSCTDGDKCTILENILSTEPPRTKEVTMDRLFSIILTCIPAVHLICQTLIRSSKPLPLQESPHKVSFTVSQSTYQSPILNMMQTFLIENGRDETDNPLFSIHPSLEDFLISSRRCHGTTLYVDRLDPTPSLTMVDICFHSMEKGFRRNICSLDDMALNEDIPDRDKRLGQYIPVVLQHACRNWIFHLEALDSDGKHSIISALNRLDTFISKHLLHWIECMSLLGWVDVISTSLERLSSWLTKNNVPSHDVRLILTMDAIQFIHAFAPIISKAAMHTYFSALPLMPPDSLLFKEYFAMSLPGLKVSGPRYSSLHIIRDPRVILSTIDSTVHGSTSSGGIIALALKKGGAAFLDTKTGNEIGSRIPAGDFYRLITFSPDGQWIATQNKHQRALDIWNVQTRGHTKTIAKESGELDSEFVHITYSADGTKVMIVTSEYSNPSRPTVFIWDVTTDKLVLRLEVSIRDKVAISPDGSQIAIADQFRIQINDVSTWHCQSTTQYDRAMTYTHRLIWSPNGQFLAFEAIFTKDSVLQTGIYLLSFRSGSAKVPDLCLLTHSISKRILDLAYSPDSSKVVAIYGIEHEMTLSIMCTWTGNPIGTIPFELDRGEATIAFAPDGQDILICGYNQYFDRKTIVLLRFHVVLTNYDLQPYLHYPPKFHPSGLSQTPLTIEYSHDTSGPIVDYASQVDADGWILNTKGERQIWTPCPNYQLSSPCKPQRKGQTQYRTLEVTDPETKAVVLRYVIAFEQEGVNQMQETTASVE